MSFKAKLLDAAEKNRSWLCVGLDPDLRKIPREFGSEADAVLRFNRAIIEATWDLVCAYKPNVAFYECLGPHGLELLDATIKAIPGNIPVIIDAKRGDIGNSADMYARAIFERLGGDAVTVSPYLGKDSVDSFTKYMDKGVFILCLTSNESSSDIQKQRMLVDTPPENVSMPAQATAETLSEFLGSSTKRVYEYVAELANRWNVNDNIGLVAGATSPDDLSEIRGIAGDSMPILIPGVGAQGGDLEKSVELGSNSAGELAIVNVARGIIYALSTGPDLKKGIRDAAQSFRQRISEAVNRKARSRG